MSHIVTDRFSGSSAPILSAALLARVHDINLDYLELLIAAPVAHGSAAQVEFLPKSLIAALAALPAPARSSLAGTPFTLYSLGFEDETFWRAACEPGAGLVAQRYAPAAAASMHCRFCEVALLYAWHVASSSMLAARMVYAMPENTAQMLAATPLWRLKRIANDYPALLTPRWPTNPGFWPDLVRFAAARDEGRLHMAQLLGNQLIASELEYAAVRNGGGQHALSRLTPSPRLLGRKLRVGGVSEP